MSKAFIFGTYTVKFVLQNYSVKNSKRQHIYKKNRGEM